MDEQIQSFKDLKVWQKAVEIVQDVYELTKNFPKEELYGLTSQMRRSAVSIPSNIAEGFRRFHNTEFKRFLFIALGSTAELETQLIISANLGYIDATQKDKVCDKLLHLGRMVTALRQKLK